MYARSTTIQADPQRIDAGIAHVRDEVMPAIQDMEGCIGLSMLCDRDSGRCIVTTSWGSEEAMRATAENVREMRERAAAMLGGGFDVQEWEVGAMHRKQAAGDDACARVTWSRAQDTSRMDAILDAWKMTVPAKLEEMEGFCSVSLMIDRASGRAVGTATFADRAAMDRARDTMRAMREKLAGAMGVDITEVAEFDLVIHHLRVPEMA